MSPLLRAFGLCLLGSAFGCGASNGAAQSAEASSASAEPDTAPPADAAPTTKPADSAAPPAAKAEAERPPMEQLARDMIKTGRKIGWSSSKRAFAYGMPWTAGPGRGFRIEFQTEDGKVEMHEVCKPGECEQTLDEDMAREIPNIAAKLSAGDYQAVWGNGWAPGQPELELTSAGIKLSFDKGRLSLVDGKSKKPLGSAPGKAAPVAVFVVKDAKVLVVDFSPDGGPTHEFRSFKLP